MTPAEFQQTALDRTRGVLVDLDEPFQLLLAALLVGGNVLIEGVPGTAKTLMARCLAALLGDSVDSGVERFQRIQFTPDLMPSDILGTSVFHLQSATFTFRRGPDLRQRGRCRRGQPRACQDPVRAAGGHGRAPGDGRGPAHAAAAGLSGGGDAEPGRVRRHLPAARSPARPLPVQGAGGLRLGCGRTRQWSSATTPGLQVTDLVAAGVSPVADLETVMDLRGQVAGVKVDDSVAEYLVAIGRASRGMPEVQYGASVRGALGLLHASKAMAAFAGRDYVTPDDVKSVAAPVLRHRIAAQTRSRAGRPAAGRRHPAHPRARSPCRADEATRP